ERGAQVISGRRPRVMQRPVVGEGSECIRSLPSSVTRKGWVWCPGPQEFSRFSNPHPLEEPVVLHVPLLEGPVEEVLLALPVRQGLGLRPGGMPAQVRDEAIDDLAVEGA